MCSRVRRIEIFSPEGKFIERINLEVPADEHFAYPTCLLLDPAGGYLIGYGLSRHLVDAYDSKGRFRKTLLRREEPIHIPGNNLGNASQIEWTRDDRTLIHFSIFDGSFHLLEPESEISRKFFFHDETAAASAGKLREAVRGFLRGGRKATSRFGNLIEATGGPEPVSAAPERPASCRTGRKKDAVPRALRPFGFPSLGLPARQGSSATG